MELLHDTQYKCVLIKSILGLTRKSGMAQRSLAIPSSFLDRPGKLHIKRQFTVMTPKFSDR